MKGEMSVSELGYPTKGQCSDHHLLFLQYPTQITPSRLHTTNMSSSVKFATLFHAEVMQSGKHRFRLITPSTPEYNSAHELLRQLGNTDSFQKVEYLSEDIDDDTEDLDDDIQDIDDDVQDVDGAPSYVHEKLTKLFSCDPFFKSITLEDAELDSYKFHWIQSLLTAIYPLDTATQATIVQEFADVVSVNDATHAVVFYSLDSISTAKATRVKVHSGQSSSNDKMGRVQEMSKQQADNFHAIFKANAAPLIAAFEEASKTRSINISDVRAELRPHLLASLERTFGRMLHTNGGPFKSVEVSSGTLSVLRKDVKVRQW